ncbi:LLM class flavin-dependent oxidoreductase [Saxibacter everestensis]|uniref:LLM class flavin-dependent oxidoreductase n=1 Tax=Saxibacter everestensis TaxID=2909229 RepID=A0ABY8QQB3_9MICO|nr:LLM class flavin-dependent oxidoreductase [Brevibacteriaceae bacterium ZFBP1038]
MTDYGHELQFGIFPTPDASQACQTIELAKLADVSGLDLVTVQDHPYQAKHFDAWTLLSVIAAQTSAVRVAPNVANLPLRSPVVLARSIATLDRLTGGRVELGLGTGAFWDAIVAAGGERLAPKEAVDALIEAIQVIRGVWGTGSVSVDGKHHHVKGLHAGPSPAHDVGIWLGAYKPRMLRVTGRLADGWIPSMGYADHADLGGMNAAIDEAAVAAGRGPQAIRRIYNVVGRFGSESGFLLGTPGNWAEQLATLALDEGMSTFILGTDDPTVVRRFADEVAPAARELVAQERALLAGSAAPAERTEVSAGANSEHRAPLAATPTPDDGIRLSSAVPWDESSRPVIQRPNDDFYTPEQQAQPQHLIDIHDQLRAELEQLRDVLAQVRQGQLNVGAARSVINTMTMRQNNWTLGAYCESYCRIVTGHHTLEDRSVFRHLRRSEPKLADVLDRLEEEHHVIADVLEQVDRSLVELVADKGYDVEGEVKFDDLQAAIDLLTDTLLSHLAYEERELLHPLAQHGLS